MELLKGIVFQLRLTWRLLRDDRVPLYLKAVPFLGLVYLISPIDFIPDLFVGLGQLDDIGIIFASLRLFEALTPKYLVEEHRAIMLSLDSGDQPPTIEARRYRIDREKAKRG